MAQCLAQRRCVGRWCDAGLQRDDVLVDGQPGGAVQRRPAGEQGADTRVVDRAGDGGGDGRVAHGDVDGLPRDQAGGAGGGGVDDDLAGAGVPVAAGDVPAEPGGVALEGGDGHVLAHAWHAGGPGAADGPCVGGAGHGRVAGRPGLARQRAGHGLLLAGRERLLGSRRASRDRHRVLPQVATPAEPGQGGAQAGGENYRGQPEGDGGQGDRGAGGPGQRGGQPGGHRPGQGQLAEQPVSAVAVAGRRGLPGRDRLHRTQPPGPQRRHRGYAGQCQPRARARPVHRRRLPTPTTPPSPRTPSPKAACSSRSASRASHRIPSGPSSITCRQMPKA